MGRVKVKERFYLELLATVAQLRAENEHLHEVFDDLTELSTTPPYIANFLEVRWDEFRTNSMTEEPLSRWRELASRLPLTRT